MPSVAAMLSGGKTVAGQLDFNYRELINFTSLTYPLKISILHIYRISSSQVFSKQELHMNA